jgi:hypothetical protein
MPLPHPGLRVAFIKESSVNAATAGGQPTRVGVGPGQKTSSAADL